MSFVFSIGSSKVTFIIACLRLQCDSKLAHGVLTICLYASLVTSWLEPYASLIPLTPVP